MPPVMLNIVFLFCSASGLERDSSEPDGLWLTGKLCDLGLASEFLFWSLRGRQKEKKELALTYSVQCATEVSKGFD